VQDDPQFKDRLQWFPADVLGADQLPFPVKVAGEEPLVPTKAPEVGEHTEAVLRDVLGYDDATIASLKDAGAIT
jgi:crotonobetainyl-CoA:carnitine CoA-transferase CaiB-like acyl-CoA transferase